MNIAMTTVEKLLACLNKSDGWSDKLTECYFKYVMDCIYISLLSKAHYSCLTFIHSYTDGVPTCQEQLGPGAQGSNQQPSGC